MIDSADRRRVVVPLRPRPRPSRPPLSPADEAAVYAFTGAEAPAVPVPAPSEPARWEDRAADAIGFIRKRLTGTYEVDEYGFDPELTEAVALPALQVLYRKWFRVEVNGVSHVPSAGGALLVANHSGGLAPWDLAMTAVAVRTEHPAQRYLRLLGAELAFRAPGIGTVARRTGATLACAADAERLLRTGELVGTWPEGRNDFIEQNRLMHTSSDSEFGQDLGVVVGERIALELVEEAVVVPYLEKFHLPEHVHLARHAGRLP